MESGLRVLLLTGLAAATTGCSLFGREQPPAGQDAGAVGSPSSRRRWSGATIKTPKIDTEDFEITAFVRLHQRRGLWLATPFTARGSPIT